MSAPYLVYATTAALFLYVAFLPIIRLWHRHHPGTPPGPKALPFIGNIHQLPTELLEQAFARWAQTYGDPVFARFFQTPMLIINTQRVARDLLEKKGSIYSSRPRTVLLSEMIQWYTLALLPYDSEPRRKQRKWIQSAFGDKAVLKSYEPIRRRETYNLLLALMRDPQSFAVHIKRFVAALLTEITYGHTIQSLDDPYLVLMDKATKDISDGTAAAVLVDFFPVLRLIPSWMPGAGFKRCALEVREKFREATHRPYQAVKTAVMAGTPVKPSLVASLIEDAHMNGILQRDERDIIAAAGTIYAAGLETTKSALISFVLAMVVYTEVLHKAQEEIDRVVGVDRLPQLEDRNQLPYIECIVKEALRWSASIPLGIPHCLTEDDEHEGHTIPKGSTVLSNIWAMTRDEEIYPDASTFRPERFLNMDTKTAERTDPRATVFGFGRRTCPGRYFADANIFMIVASMVATLNIAKARDSKGQVITPSVEFHSGMTRYPPEFTCNITPRSQRAEDMVSEMLTSLLD